MRNHGRTEQALPGQVERERWGTATPFGVEIDQGVDTLPGVVNDAAQRLAAQEAARCIARILDVTDDLEVVPLAGHECADTEIALAVHAALEWDVLVARAVHDL